MKSDLDRLMAERDLNALVVTGGEHPNMPRRYLANGLDIHGGIVVKARGAAPTLIVGAMEREEARKSGLAVLTFDDLGQAELFREVKDEADRRQATLKWWGRVLEHFAIAPGKIGLYGTGDINQYIELAQQLNHVYPSYRWGGEWGRSLFDEAYLTKDADEIAILRQVAAGTNRVLRQTWDFIASHHADGDTVVTAAGAPLTIGDVKRFIRRALMDVELEDTGMIFAQGRDAGIPHSRGDSAAPLKLGQSIIFDLFPRQMGGGYHHDVTRTWCIGYAPPAVQAAYDTVMAAFQVALDAYAEPGQPTHVMQEAVQSFFEASGHPTLRSHPGTTDGYVHSLGHGIGLNIHERPSISHLNHTDRFEIGNIITIEPGLYYPERGFGVRIEDAIAIGADGQLETLTDFPKTLILPLNG